MRTIPKLDPNLFSINTHLENMLESEFDLDINGCSAFINKYAIGYTLDDEGDPMIMFEVDGCLFWRAYFRTVLYNTQVELGWTDSPTFDIMLPSTKQCQVSRAAKAVDCKSTTIETTLVRVQS